MCGNHTADTRQPTIIRFRVGLLAVLAVTVGVTARAQQSPVDVGTACVSCLILHVPPDAVSSAEVRAGALEGLTIVTDSAHPLAAGAVDRIAAWGAQPGLVTAVSTLPPAELLGRASVVIVHELLDDDSSVFALRTLATSARGARPEVRILVDGVVPDRARAYVDGRVDRRNDLTRPAARALVEASRQGGAEPILVTLHEVDWAALVDFAAQRAIGTEVVALGSLTADQI